MQNEAELPSVDTLKCLLDYDPSTGLLAWKHRDASWFTDKGRGGASGNAARWNAMYAGTPALNNIDANGYRSGSLMGKAMKAHRVILTMVSGSWPDSTDHINGDRSDNRLDNLRDVSAQENAKNQALRSDNTSGHFGISQRADSKRFKVTIGNKYIGTFLNLADAIEARRIAMNAHGYHQNHGRRTKR